MASLEERLFEAYKLYGQVTLSWEDVASLVRDDCVATRITNAACHEAGAEEIGLDAIGSHRSGEDWKRFKARLRREQKGKRK